MHRLLAESEELESASPRLSREAINHLKVIRPKEGESIELFDGRGRFRVYVFADGGLKGERSKIEEVSPPSPLTLFACITKGSRWDWTIEKATELGVTRIVPVVSERTIVRISSDERETKRARWIRIAQEAARQSDAKWIPEILAPIAFDASLKLVRGTKCLVGALTEKTRQIGSCDGNAIYVGPEGDFSSDELASLIEIATPVSFGTTVLRAETAAIYGVSVLKSKTDVFAC